MNISKQVNVSLGTRCTLKCPKCRRTEFKEQGIPIDGGDLSMEDFKKLAAKFDDLILCGGVADPVLHPQFLEILEYSYKNGNRVSVSNAASHRPSLWYKKAFTANPDATWIFGIDGLPKDSHKYRINQDGEKLFQMAKMAVSMGITVVWQYIIFKYNENDIEEARSLAEENDMHFKIWKSDRWDNMQDPFLHTKKEFYNIGRRQRPAHFVGETEKDVLWGEV